MQLHNPSKVKRIKYPLGNNRAITKARKVSRLLFLGMTVPKRQDYHLQRLAHIYHMHLAYKKQIQADLRGFDTPDDMKNALHFYRESRKGVRQAKADERHDKWIPILAECMEQQARNEMGITKAHVASFCHESGYKTAYSGKLKQMFLTAMPEGYREFDIIHAIHSAFGDVPFGLKLA